MSYSVRGDDEEAEAERADDDDDDDDDEVEEEEDAARDRRAEEDDGENAQAVIVIPPEAGMASRAATLNLIIDLINYSDDIIIIPFLCLVFVSIKCSLFMLLLCVFEGTKNFRPTEWIHRGELLRYNTCSFAFWIFHYFTIPLIRGADGRADKNKSGGELMSGG